MSEEEEIRQRVQERLSQRRGFVLHLAGFIAFNIIMWGIWLNSTPEGAVFPFPFFVTIPWLLGLFFHGLDYYSKYGPGRFRREEKIQQEMEREIEHVEAIYDEKRKTRAER